MARARTQEEQAEQEEEVRQSMVQVLLLHGTPREVVADKILQILERAGRPLTTKEVYEELHRQRVSVGKNTVGKLLRTLAGEGKVACTRLHRATLWWLPGTDAAVMARIMILSSTRMYRLARLIKTILEEATRPLTTFELLRELAKHGVKTSQRTVSNLLNKLAQAGELEKRELKIKNHRVTTWWTKTT